jgi:hypothetical protein
MAHRLATEYVKTCLELTEAEMMRFIGMFSEHEAHLQVKVLGNGSHEFILENASGEEINLSFEPDAGKYICTGSCKFSSLQLANLMRKAVSEFKGSAVVNRIYSDFTMVYHYSRGSVVRIAECRDGKEKVVYEYKNPAGELEDLYRSRQVELEIVRIRSQVNELLDMRNAAFEDALTCEIDRRLGMLTHRLFILEA